MTRAGLLLIVLTFVLPSDGSAQVVPSPGERIRVEQVDGTIHTGWLGTVTAEAIQLSVDSSRVEGTIEIPRSQITTLEHQQGTRNKSNLGAIVGFLAGGGIAVATLKESQDDCELGFPGVVGCASEDFEQLLGDVYEWTSSPFVGYPGFTSFPYPEYSEVFFDDPEFRVLRGASWATSADVTRSTFRNWDYRSRRQIFAGIRLVWEAI